MSNPKLTHSELVEKAARWLRNTVNCGVVLKELSCMAAIEQPDVIGFKEGRSFLVECKTSRADFLVDLKKPFRVCPEVGMGNWRFYMSPPGIIKPEDMPKGWELLHVHGRQVRWATPAPTGNYWGAPPFEGNRPGEMGLMYSALRKLAQRGHLDEIYKPK